MIQSIDINELNFHLHFKNNESVVHQIDEPIGWDEVNLIIEQGDMYARTFKIGDNEFNLKFTPVSGLYPSQFDKIIAYYELYGYESIVDLIVSIGSEEWFSCELDFSRADTNKENYFECPVVINSVGAEIERKEDVKINLLSTKTLDNEEIEPIEVHDVLLRAKEILDVSLHQANNENITEDVYSGLGEDGRQNIADNWIFKFFGHNVYHGVGETLSYENGAFYNVGFTGLIQNGIAKQDMGVTHILKQKGNIKIKIKFDFEIYNVNGFKNASFGIYKVETDGENFQDGDLIYDRYFYINNSKTFYQTSGSVDYEMELDIERFTKIAPAFTVRTQNGRIDKSSFVRVSNVSMMAEMVDIFPDTKSKMVRLIDAGKHILNNYTNGGLNFEHPLFDSVFRDLLITTGFYIRGFEDEPMPISYKEWLEQIKAFNCDVQINGNNVFIGRQEEFYNDVEIGRFEFKPDVDSFSVIFNDDRMYNKFVLGFDKYEDSDKSNTIDSFTTETEWYVPNKRVKETKEVKFPFIANDYMIERTRREGIDVEPTTAKKKDNDFYIVDSILKYGEYLPDGTYINYLTPIYTNRSDEGFERVEKLFSPSTAYNLRLSPKRLILDHWSPFISEITPYTGRVKLESSFFKNNGDLITVAQLPNLTISDTEIKEDADVVYLPKSSKISPYIYTFDLGLRVKYNEIKELFTAVIEQKGYITLYDDNTEIKVYPKKLEYVWKHEKLMIEAELKEINTKDEDPGNLYPELEVIFTVNGEEVSEYDYQSGQDLKIELIYRNGELINQVSWVVTETKGDYKEITGNPIYFGADYMPHYNWDGKYEFTAHVKINGKRHTTRKKISITL